RDWMTAAPEAGGEGVAASDATDRGLGKRVQNVLHVHPTAVPALGLVARPLLFRALVGDGFFRPLNFSLVLRPVPIIGIRGVAETLVILTAGIDLSVGAIMVLCSVVMGQLAVHAGLPAPLAIGLGLLVGVVAGFINGLLVALVRLPPFIVTLGTWNIFFALNLWYSHSETIRAQEIEATAPLLQVCGTAINVAGARLTAGSIFMVLMFAFFWYVLNWTAWGRHVYALGDDPDAARLVGIRTNRTLISAYVVGGLICALA